MCVRDHDLMVERHGRQMVHAMPLSVVGKGRCGGEGDQPEKRRGDGAWAGNSARFGEHRQLFEVCQLTHVYLLGELAPDGRGEILVGAYPATGQGPRAAVRIEGSLPQQHRELGRLGLVKVTYLEHHG
ncbi:Uncharacterised protein [Mycobacteroides abscessus subsp. abscessus]|nr:Uncharacterised protein [Mycobacteroides abscessus subsp. abscessus]